MHCAATNGRDPNARALYISLYCLCKVHDGVLTLSLLYFQVRRIKQFRAQMSISRSRSSAIFPTDIGNKTITGNLIRPSPPPHTGLRQRLSSALLGSKGSMLIPSSPSTDLHVLSAKGKDQDFKQENPVARLKLLLVCFSIQRPSLRPYVRPVLCGRNRRHSHIATTGSNRTIFC